MIRESLGKIERRRTLSDRYGIPLRTSVPQPRKARPRRLVRTAAVVGVLLLLAAAIAPMVFPDSIGKLVRDIQKPKQVGVLVGVPDSSPAASQPETQVTRNTSISPPAVVSSQPAKSNALPETPAPANAATTPNPFHVSPADVQQAQIANAQSHGTAPTNAAENAAAATPDTAAPTDTAANSLAQANTEPPPATASRSAAESNKEICCLNSQTRSLQPEFGRIFRARPHSFGAQSRYGYHVRWPIDPAFAFGAHCHRRAGRRRICAPPSEPGVH